MLEHWSDRNLGNLKTLDKWATALAAACPAVDLLAEARAALAWELSNPKKRKNAMRRFLGSWMKTSQDKGGNLRAANDRTYPSKKSDDQMARVAARVEREQLEWSR
jgi:hypothetical protein